MKTRFVASLITFCHVLLTTDGNYLVGSIFDIKNQDTYNAFRYSISKNAAMLRTPKGTQLIDTVDQYDHSYAICNQMGEGSIAIFGVQNVYSADMITDYCATFHMPFINIGISESYRKSGPFQIHMQPRLEKALVDLMVTLGWTKFIYMYNSQEGMVRLYHLIEEINLRNVRLRMQFVHVNTVNEAREYMDSLDREDPSKIRKIVIDMSTADTYDFLKRENEDTETSKLNVHFLLARLHISEFIMDGFEHGGMNITGFRMVDFQRNLTTKNFIKEWKNAKKWGGGFNDMISYQAAFAMDAVDIFVRALKNLKRNKPDIFRNPKFFRLNETFNNGSRKVFCEPRPDQVQIKPWALGNMIVEAIKKETFWGLTGKVAFDEDGFRTGFKLELVQTTTESAYKKLGTWSPRREIEVFGQRNDRCEGLDIPACRLSIDHDGDTLVDVTRQEKNKTLVVTSLLVPPYLMLRKSENGENFTGNDRFIGFTKNLTVLLASFLGDGESEPMKYEIRIAKDRKHGNLMNGSWNGMVGELIRGEADLAIADLTINSDREKVIDFSKPFMNTGISIMIKKPTPEEDDIFSFLSPLSNDIWMCISFAYTGVSVVMFLVSRFSPSEWHVEDEDEGPKIKNDFSISNSLWFTVAAFMQQGCEVCPRSISGRVVGSVWWFFTLILISSYTANLAAFLTVSRMNAPIQSADDLAKQTDVAYGTIRGGTTKTFFKESNISTYERMWSAMSSNEDVFVDGNEEGVGRVRKGNYAFLVESKYQEFIDKRDPCDTIKVGANLDTKGYGVGLPKGSPYKDRVTLGVLEFIEEGKIHELEDYWWNIDKSQGNICEKEKEVEKDVLASAALGIGKIAGVFFILIGGMALASVVSIFELIYKALYDSRREKTSFRHELKAKAKFALKGKLEKESDIEDDDEDHRAVHTSVSTYTYAAPASAQLITLDGYSDHGNHTQV